MKCKAICKDAKRLEESIHCHSDKTMVNHGHVVVDVDVWSFTSSWKKSWGL
jgi:hypothetical protein